jgi:hypothetical protein
MSQAFLRQCWTGGVRLRDASALARGWRKKLTKNDSDALREA